MVARLNLSEPTAQVMGIINVTPDSFYAGSCVNTVEQAIQSARDMVSQGACIIDVGGESTRPGAADVGVNEEINRTLPVIQAIRNELDVAISIDSSKADVIQAAVAAGATMINDVRALQEPGALEVAALSQAQVCLMHMQGSPRTMQQTPKYKNVVTDIADFFQARIKTCLQAGIKRENLLIDPGFGFGKTPEQNFTLIKHLQDYQQFSLPIVIGVSRKSTIGYVLDAPPDECLAGSLSLTTLALMNGARIIRTHDVKPTVDAVKLFQAYQQAP